MRAKFRCCDGAIIPHNVCNWSGSAGEAEQEAKQIAIYDQMEAAIARANSLIRILRERYREEKHAGTLSVEDEARYENIFAQCDKMRSEPRVKYGFGQFYIEPAKTKSNSMKPNLIAEGIHYVDKG